MIETSTNMSDRSKELKRESWNVVRNFNPRRPWSVVWVSDNGILSLDRSFPDDSDLFSPFVGAEHEARRRISDGLAGSTP